MWYKNNEDGSTKKFVVISNWNKHEIYLLPTIKVTKRVGRPNRIKVSIFFLGWSVLFATYVEWTVNNFLKYIKEDKNESKTV